MCPGEAGRAAREAAGLGEQVGAAHALFAEVGGIRRSQRDLVGGRLQVRVQDVRVGEVDDRLLDGAREQALRLSHEELVEGVLAGHQHRPAVAGPAGPAPALEQAGHRAGEAGDQRDIQAADVDAELEGAGGDHRVQLVIEEAALYVAALLRRVAGAVGHDALGRSRAAGRRRLAQSRARSSRRRRE